MPNGEKYTGVVEIAPLANDLKLEFSAELFEDKEATHPVTIIRPTETLYVKVNWQLTGKLARYFCGEWCIAVWLESIGPAPETGQKIARVTMDPCATEGDYYTFEFPGNEIYTGECGTLYILAVTMVAFDPCGDVGPISGYIKGESVMFAPGPKE